MSWIVDRIKSFSHAFYGIRTVIIDEPNAKIHMLAAVVVVALGFIFKISRIEWIMIIVCVVSVFAAEMINTSIENICDAISHKENPYIKKAKDIAAGAVLVISLGALVIGILIFYPYLRSIML